MFALLLPAFVTGMSTTCGAVPFIFVRSFSRRFYDTLLGLGAGLMLSAATLGLLSAALHEVRSGDVLVPLRLALVLGGFLAGVALLRLMDGLIPHEHAGGHHVHMRAEGAAFDPAAHGVAPGGPRALQAGIAAAQLAVPGPVAPGPHCALDASGSAADRTARAQGLLVVGVMFLHRLPEGLAIGAAYAGGGQALGLTLVAAVGVQNAVEGSVMAAPLRRGGLGAGALLALVAATGLAVPLAAVAGYYLSSSVQGALPPMLSLAAGALIYLTCNEVIPESHSHGNELRATFGIVAGFVVIMVLQVVFGHFA